MVDDEIEQLSLRAQMIRMCGFPVVTASGMLPSATSTVDQGCLFKRATDNPDLRQIP